MQGQDDEQDDESGQADRRGSHATTYGQGFSWVMIWTIVGALIPGSGLVAAGWRRLGAGLLFVLGLVVAFLAAAALAGNVQKRALTLALNTTTLMYITIGAIVLGLIWAAIIVFTHLQLRRYANLSSEQRIFSGIVVLALLVGVALPAYVVGSYAMIQRDLVNSITSDAGEDAGTTTKLNHKKKADPWAGIPRINVLLIGSDAGSDRIGTRPDTMIIASIDTKSGNTVLFSLPRNLQHAPFPPGTGGAKAFPDGFYCPGGACLLNAVWTWAEGTGHQYYAKYKKNAGLRATEDALQGVTGLKIDQYASLNLNGFKDFVSALGGITVNVNERLPIGGSSENRVATGWIEKGKHQHLDGYHALWFARSRWSTNDFDRMRRQRCVIGAVVKKANPTVLAKQFPALAKAAKNNMSTGVKTDDLDAWLTLALRVKKAKVTSLPFDDHVVTDRVNPDFDRIHTLVQKAISDSTQPEVKETATPTPDSSPSSTTSTKKPTTKKPTDPEVAQSLKDVC